MSYQVLFHPDAKKALDGLDNAVRLRVLKKITQMEREDLPSRHLRHGSPFFVEEIGQYRVCFTVEKNKVKFVLFAGDHKEYDKWCKTHK